MDAYRNFDPKCLWLLNEKLASYKALLAMFLAPVHCVNHVLLGPKFLLSDLVNHGPNFYCRTILFITNKRLTLTLIITGSLTC